MKKRRHDWLITVIVLVWTIYGIVVIGFSLRDQDSPFLVEDSVTVVDGNGDYRISPSRLMNTQDSLDYLEHQSETEISK